MIGSLCSGYGALDLAVGAHFGMTVAWHAEIDPAACRALEARFPDVPNHGDLRTADWSAVEPVDVLCAGFPCQPASAAGKQLGMADERWLWDEVARAVQDLRPRRVVLENVPGLLTVDRGRAWERVVCDLASLGYVGRHGVVRASDAGAPHRRARVFVVATDACGTTGRSWHAQPGDGGAPDVRRGQTEPRGLRGASPDAVSYPRRIGDRDDRTAPHPSGCIGSNEPGGSYAPGQPQRTVTGAGGRDSARRAPQGVHVVDGTAALVAWGPYEPAIRRWEHVTGRLAPSPTEPGRNGPRLSQQFVEWMMGLPAGWVTDLVGRGDALRLLGNGVVPQQAMVALRLLAAEPVEENTS